MSVLAHAVPLFLIVIAAMVGVVVFYAVLSVLKERNLGVLRTRMPANIRNVIYVGAYMFAAILPMSLVKHHVLQLPGRIAHGIAVAYTSLIVVLILAAMALAFGKQVRRHKAVVIAFFCALVMAAGSSPLVWAMLANASQAAEPFGVLAIFAMATPGPAYFLLRYQLGWL